MNTTATPPILVFDAFGTLVQLRRKRQPYATLWQWIVKQWQAQERDAPAFERFWTAAITQDHTLDSLAQVFDLDLEAEPRLRDQLLGTLAEDVADVALFPETVDVLQACLAGGHTVTVGSNLAAPYGPAVRQVLETALGVATVPFETVVSGGTPAPVRLAYSYAMGTSKPIPAFYTQIERGLRAAGQGGAIGMVGDKPQEDCQAPSAAGWTAWRVQRDAGQTLWDCPFLAPLRGPKN